MRIAIMRAIHFRNITKKVLFNNPFMVPGIMCGIIIGRIFKPYTISQHHNTFHYNKAAVTFSDNSFMASTASQD